MPRALTGAVAALLLGALGWGFVAVGRHAAPPPMALPQLSSLPAFALQDHEGRAFSRADLAGSVWVVDFIFTRCAGQCPLMNQRMRAVARQFPAGSGVRFLSISVDPEHDTPAVLAAYVQALAAEAPHWRWLTGSEEAVWRLAREGFRLGVSSDGTAEEPIVHSVRLALVDGEGHIRGYYDALDAAAVARLTQAIRQLLAERGR